MTQKNSNHEIHEKIKYEKYLDQAAHENAQMSQVK